MKLKLLIERPLLVDFINDTDPSKHHKAEKELASEIRNAMIEDDKESAFEQLDWEAGEERVFEEGSNMWEQLRLSRGWSRNEVEVLTKCEVIAERQQMFEERPDMPDVQELCALAHLYEMTPGDLLDEMFQREGRRIRKEAEDDVTSNSVSRDLKEI